MKRFKDHLYSAVKEYLSDEENLKDTLAQKNKVYLNRLELHPDVRREYRHVDTLELDVPPMDKVPDLKAKIQRSARASHKKSSEILNQFRVEVAVNKERNSRIIQWIENARKKKGEQVKIDMPKGKKKSNKVNTYKPPTKKSKPIAVEKGNAKTNDKGTRKAT